MEKVSAMVEYSKSDLIQFNGRFLSPNVILIEPKSKIFTSNTLLFNDEVKLVVDTGFQYGTGQLDTAKEFLNIGVDDLVFFSHYHIDHIIGSYTFSETPKLIHSLEKDALVNNKTFLQFCHQSEFSSQVWNQWSSHFKRFLMQEGLSRWSDLLLNDIQSIDLKNGLNLGKKNLDIIHLPGHSPGHCGLYEPDSQVLFIGDIDLSKFGPWYGWRNANLQSFRQSIVTLEDFINNHEISWIIPSHTVPIEDKQECLRRLGDYCKIFDKRKTRIMEFITQKQKNGTTLEEITEQSIIYQGKKSNPPFVFETFEQFMIEHHLEELSLEKSIFYDNHRIYAT